MRSSGMRPAAGSGSGASARGHPATGAIAVAAAPPPPPPPPVAAPALSLHVFHTRALLRSAAAAAVGAGTGTDSSLTRSPPSATAVHGGVGSLFRLLQRLGADECDSGGAHLPALLDLLPASTPHVDDGRVMLVAEGWSRGLHQCATKVGSHLPFLRSVSLALLRAISTLNAHSVFHKCWKLEHVRFDAHGRVKLEGTLANNAEARGEAAGDGNGCGADSSDFIHPAMIPPEVLLAGPHALHDAESQALLLRSDAYQLGVLLLFLLRGNWPLPPRAAPRAADGGEHHTHQNEGAGEEDELTGVEEAWQLHFAPQRSPHLGSDGNATESQGHKHPQCRLCSPDFVVTSSDTAAHDDDVQSSGTARLCLRCWMDLRKLHPSFVPPPPPSHSSSSIGRSAPSSPSPPLSLLSSTVSGASPAYLGAYASFLELLGGLLEANPLTRLSPSDACNHPFYSLTSRWGSKEKQSRNVAHVWRRKMDAAFPGMDDPSSSAWAGGFGAGRANSLRTETNQLALDPFFRVRGFNSVQAGTSFAEGAAAAAAAANAAGETSGAPPPPPPPRICGVCHQPISAHMHPSSPAACHCLQPFSCADLYHVWRDALAARGMSLQQWVESQSAAANDPRAASASNGRGSGRANGAGSDESAAAVDHLLLRGFSRYNGLVDALPAMILSESAPPSIGIAASAQSEPSFHSLSLCPPALPRSQRFFVPLLPLYHVLKRCIVARQEREIAALWAGLDLMDKEAAASEAATAAAGSDKQPAPPMRLRKAAPTSPSPSSAGVSSSTDEVLSDPSHSFLVQSLSALVEVRLGLRLYPATRTELVSVARGRVEALYDEPQAVAAGAGAAPERWSVYRAGAGVVAPPSIVSPSLRAALWPALLGVSSRDTSAYTIATECALTSLQSHAESAQIAKDCERLQSLHPSLSGRVSQLRLRRLLGVYLATHGEVVYWQGMHELLGAVAALYFSPCGGGSGGASDQSVEGLVYALFSRLVQRPYLRDMFVRDNAAALGHKVAAVSRLLSFLDPVLAAHLQLDATRSPTAPAAALACPLSLWIVPCLFTAFAHVLPLHQLWQLWDVLFAYAAPPPEEDELELELEASWAPHHRPRSARQRRASRRAAEDVECEWYALVPVALLHLLRSMLLAKSGRGNGFQDALVQLGHKLHTVDTQQWVRMVRRLRARIHPAVLRAVVRQEAVCRDQEEGAHDDGHQEEEEREQGATHNAPGQLEEDEDFLPEPVILSPDFTPLVAAAAAAPVPKTAAAPSAPHSQGVLLAPVLPLAILRELVQAPGAGGARPPPPAAAARKTHAAGAGSSSAAPILIVDLRDESRRAAPAFPGAITVPVVPDWHARDSYSRPSHSLLAAVEWVSQYAQEWRTQLEQSHALTLSKAAAQSTPTASPPPLDASSFLALLADDADRGALFAHHLIAAGVPRVCTVSL